MANCISKEELLEVLHKLHFDNKVGVNYDQEKSLRFDITQLNPTDLIGFLKGDKTSVTAIKNLVGSTFYRKIGFIQNKNKKDIKNFLDKVVNKDDVNATNSRFIALQNVIDAIKGEADKAKNNNLSISSVSTNGVTPNIPIRRIASVIGRQAMYQQGYRFKTTEDSQRIPSQIEVMYSKVGLAILKDLETTGLLSITEKGTYINDFVEGDNYQPSNMIKSENTKATGQVVNINMEELVSDNKKYGEFNKLYFSNNALAREMAYKYNKEGDAAPQLETIASVLGVTTKLTTASTIEEPLTIEPTDKDIVKAESDDYNSVSEGMKTARKTIAKTGSKLGKGSHVFVKQLAKAYESNKTQNFDTWALNLAVGQSNVVNNIFGLNDLKSSLEKKESQSGQNLSVSAPMEDLLIKYNDYLDDAGNPKDLYFKYNFVRNARMHNMSTILNAQSSKFARHGLTTGETTFDITSEDGKKAYKHMVAELADESGFDINDIITPGVNKKLDKYLKVYSKLFEQESSLGKKLNYINQVATEQTQFQGLPTTLISTMAAINDVRLGLETGTITTEYTTKSDATASGGMITLMEALGTNPEVVKILKSMDILKGRDLNDPKLNDVYGILQNAIEVLTGTTIEDTLDAELQNVAFSGPLQDLLDSGIYDKMVDGEVKYNTRELSKDPTMTLIYGQGRNAAVNTIAEGMADKLFIAIQKRGTAGTKAEKYLTKLLDTPIDYDIVNSDPKIYSKTVEALKSKSTSPANILYSTLDEQVSKALFGDRNEILTDVFDVLTDIQKKTGKHIKIMPPSAALGDINFTLQNLQDYGIPLEKIFDVAKDVQTKGGAVWEVATREERPVITTLKANAVHSKDTYNIYSAINDTMEKLDKPTGVIPVHDETITDPVTGALNQEFYVKRFKDMARNYDILDNALKTAELMDPNNPGIPALREKIDSIIKEKQKVIDEQFNDDTTSIFGQDVSKVPDPVIKKPDPDPDPDKQPIPKPETKEESKTETKPPKKSKGSEGYVTVKYSNSDKTYTYKTSMLDNYRKNQTFTNNVDESIEILNIQKTGTPDSETLNIELEERLTGYTKVKNTQVNPELNKEIEKILTKVYPDINLEYTLLDQGVKGEAHIEAKKVLLNENIMTQDTLPHEYAHHYIAMFRDTPQVQKGIKEWGSEEALVQAIGKQAVKQKGKAWDWWKTFSDWVTKQFRGIDNLTKEEIKNVLTDSFLTNENLGKSTSKSPKIMYSKIGDEKGVLGKAETFVNNKVTNLNDAVYSMLLGKVEAKGASTIAKAHKMLEEKFPLYFDVSNKIKGIYDDSEALQQLLQFTHLSKLNQKERKNMVQSVASKLHQDRTTRDNETMTKIDDLTENFTEDQKTHLYNFINKAPLSDYFLYGFENKTKADIEQRITELDKSMDTDEKHQIEHFMQLYTNNKVVDSKLGYNLDKHHSAGSTKAKEMKELIALKGLKALGLEQFEELQTHTELFDIIKDNSVALSMIHKDIGDGINMRPDVKGSLVGEYYHKGLQKKIILEHEIDKFGYEEGTGWRIISEPKNGKVGIAVREVDDSFYLEGAGIDLGTTTTDLNVPASIAKKLDLEANNIVQVGENHYKKVLTSEEKTDMGVIRKPGHSLVHTTSHMIAAQEAGILRKEMLKDDLRMVIDTKNSSNIEVLETLIADKDVDHPWFIKLGSKVHYKDLPPVIKAKYKPIDVGLSNIDGFNNEISLVRKDMAYWLTGDSASFFNNNPKMQRASKVIKQLVSGAKIGMAVTNPVKLAKDTISNTAYLTAMGVPLSMQADEAKKIMAEMNTLGQLRTQIAKIRVKQVAYPNDKNLQTKYDKLLKQLEEHPLNGVVERGFMNSLSSDIYNNNIDSLKGLQADINTGLEYLLKKKDGTPNMVNKYISDMANVTGDGTEVLRYIGNIVKKSESTEEMGRMLDGAADRISKIKSKEDGVAYLNNFIISPNSEIVKAGVWYNDAIDTVSKETYYRYLTQNRNMDPKEAEVLVIESFPDYKENMPLAMKMLSDYGVLMFPSYWARIHVPAYRMLMKRSLNVGLEMELANITNTHLESILDATIPVRLDSGMDLAHSPLDIIGINSIFPTQLFR